MHNAIRISIHYPCVLEILKIGNFKNQCLLQNDNNHKKCEHGKMLEGGFHSNLLILENCI